MYTGTQTTRNTYCEVDRKSVLPQIPITLR